MDISRFQHPTRRALAWTTAAIVTVLATVPGGRRPLAASPPCDARLHVLHYLMPFMLKMVQLVGRCPHLDLPLHGARSLHCQPFVDAGLKFTRSGRHRTRHHRAPRAWTRSARIGLSPLFRS